MPKLTTDQIKKMRQTLKKEMSLREGKFRGKVTVHLGTCGIAAGAREVMNVITESFDEKKITDIMFTTSGCAGFCSEEPMMTVEIGATPPVKYGQLTPEKTKKIIETHVIAGKIVKELALGMGSERLG